MTDDSKKGNPSDIDKFFEEFDKISDDLKKKQAKKPEKPKGVPSDVAPSAYAKEKIVANRSSRHSKLKDAEKAPTKPLEARAKPPLKSKSGVLDKNTKKTAEEKTEEGFIEMAKKKARNIKKKAKPALLAAKDKVKKATKRTKGKKRKSKKSKKIWLKRILAACALLMVACIVMVAFILKDTQKIDWDNIYESLAESSVIYDDAGKEVDSIYSGEGSRVIVDYDKMPKTLIDAFVSIEDKTFWDHHGFNFIRMAGAVKDALFNSERIGGTSTITQQLARNLWLAESRSERTLTRKIKEAYYAVQLERHLSKEEIIEAYLNTISLGQNSLGVQAASQSYFSKDVGELDLLECAALASLPQAPGSYSYITTVAKGDVSKDDPRIISQGDVNMYLYNDTAEGRVDLVLGFMEEQGYISAKEHKSANSKDLRKHIKPSVDSQSEEAQFFVDYTIKQVIKDLMKEYGDTEQEATQRVYSGGLEIHTTLNKKMQSAVEEQFKKNSNFPGTTGLRTDGNGNIKGDNGKIILYKYSNYFSDGGNFNLTGDEFTKDKDGNIVLTKGKRLNFYEVESNGAKDINIEFKDLYLREDGVFYSINGGVINVPAKYKTLDAKGNVVISAKFMKDQPKFMEVSDNKITISSASYTLRQQVQQPQSSMVIIDHQHGQLKAMVGGRNIEGKMNYNRSISPRQPGSSIKPIGAYGPAIQMGAEKQKISNGEDSFGTYWTAASVIKDEEMKFQGKVWPKNWYSGYKGPKTLRFCVEQSINTTAVKVLNNIGPERSSEFLRKLGVTTIVDEGSINDMNPAALALGGMTKGISPLQMASAYGTFANKGEHISITTYTEIKNKQGKLVLEPTQKKTQAMDPGTAFIMTDILRSTVTNGIAKSAAISNAPVAGKTGTTTDNYDAWFVGTTPKYAAALWIGNDVNIELSEGSGAAARLWSRIMSNALEGQDGGSFPSQPGNVSKKTVSGISEYFIDGTAPGSLDFSEEKISVCAASKDLPTPWCPKVEEVTFNSLTSDSEESTAPTFYCNLHNLDPAQFPIDPEKKLDTNFKDPNAEPEEEEEQTPKPKPPQPPVNPTSPTGMSLSSKLLTVENLESVPDYVYDNLYTLLVNFRDFRTKPLLFAKAS